MIRPTRRQFLKSTAASAVPLILPQPFAVANERKKLPVAAIVTVYRPMSHTDVIVGKILEGYSHDGGVGPDLRLASLYTDQIADQDLSHQMAEKHGFRLAKSIDEALTLGTDQLQVAGVLSIGEHGDYPYTPDTNQQMYPRRRFFDEIVAVFRRCGKSVPVFNDKHLSYRWDDAKQMFETAREMQFPLLAGSSVPLAWREPILDLPIDCEIEAALTVGYSGLEVYGFHALEAHQCMIERRKYGETGVAAVQAVTGEALQQASKDGRWSNELLDAAFKQFPGLSADTGAWLKNQTSAAMLMEHRDGLKSSVIMANGLVEGFAFAAKLKGRAEPIAMRFKLQDHKPFGHFAYLLQAINHTIHANRAAYPVERTLLTTGILDRVMHSAAESGRRLETPELNVSYNTANWPFANRADAVMTLPSD